MSRSETDLPFGDAFSPAQLTTTDGESALAAVLAIAQTHEGDPSAFDHSIGDTFFQDHRQPRERGRHVRNALGPAGYKIVDETFEFTEFGCTLLALRDRPGDLHDRFAAHILQNLHGHQLLQVVRDLEAGGRKTTEKAVKTALRDRFGLTISETGNAISQMRGWLAEAGITSTRKTDYEIDEQRIEDVLGVNGDDIDALEELSSEQQAFLRALATINPPDPIPNTEVRELAESQSNLDIGQSAIRRRVLSSLETGGFITLTDRTGAPLLVESTRKFKADVVGPILAQLEADTGFPRVALRLSFSDIADALEGGNERTKRRALDALGIRIGRLLDYTFVARRTTDLGRDHMASDVVVESQTMNFNRWHIRAQHTGRKLTPAQVLEAAAVSRLVQATTLLFVTRSGIRNTAKRIAHQIMEQDQLTILFLEEVNLHEFDTQPSQLRAMIEQEVQTVSERKQIELDDIFVVTRDESPRTQSNLQDHDHGLAEYLAGPSSDDKDEDLTDFM